MIDFNLFNAYICTMAHGSDCGCTDCQVNDSFIKKYPPAEYTSQMKLIQDELVRRTNSKSFLYLQKTSSHP